MNEILLDKIIKITEEFFGSEQHPDYIPVNKESCQKLDNINPNWLTYKLVDGEPVSWVVILPTQPELMKKFISGEITEKELMNETKSEKEFQTLYLCSAFTVSAYRRQGYITELFKTGIEKIPHTPQASLFAWPVTSEGGKLVEKLEKELHKKILIRHENKSDHN
jgi:hypothetical protein